MKKTMGLPESFASTYLVVLLLFLQLLTLGSANFSVIGPADLILALEGEAVELPCHLDPKMSAEDMALKWFLPQPSKVVHLFENREDLFGEQTEYRGRTELLREAIDYGSVAVKIRNVRDSDEGKYICSFYDGQERKEAPLELHVVAPLFPRAFPLMVALGVIFPLLGLVIIGGLYLIWKQYRDKEKLQIELRKSLFQLHEAHVTLDPNTAHPELILLENLKQVTHGATWQDLPKNPERFDRTPCVLGSEGFTSGRHCWKVEVEDSQEWILGLCRENVRKRAIIFSPENGFWTVGR
ncbi:myelin-oligodendrocyte glycoprotein-like isoform X2 [Ornithorhynchus anatinus]|nr:myelin-oligodendrocyte glycoprotein-like isoform X2 [Ornithorhynchus anatinus]